MVAAAGGVGNDNDLLFRALIDDQTTKFFEKFDQSVDRVQANTTAGFNKIDGSIKNTGINIGILSGIMSSLTTMAINGIQNLLGKIIQFGEASVELRARVDTLGVSLNQIGDNSGYSREEIAKLEEAIKKKGITTRNARESLIQMAQAELDLSKAADLARVAQDAAVNAGINSSQAFDRITQAIVTLQPEILRNLNLNVNLQSAYAKQALALGKSAEQLTLSEKKQVAMNAVLQAGALIAGTYESAMGSVGKASKSTERLVEELQYKLGGLFQPAYFEKVFRYNKLLEDLNKFLETHQKDIEEFANTLGNIFGSALDMAGPFFAILGDIFNMIGSLVTTAADLELALIGIFGEKAQQDAKAFFGNWNDFNGGLEAGLKLVVLIGGALAGVHETGKDLSVVFASLAELVGALTTGDIDKINAAAERLHNAKADLVDKTDVYAAASKYLQDAIEKMPELINGYKGVEDAAQSSSKVAEVAAQRLADALAGASAKLKDLKDKFDDQEIERQIKLQRNVIEEQIDAQFASEDRERNHQERVRQIMENSEEQKQQLMENASEQRLEIEKDYSKRLNQIKENFELDSGELARKRDANGLLALIRQNKRTLDNEKKAYEDRKKQSQESYEKTITNLDKSVQDQLKKADEAQAKELENYQRGLARQKILKDLHNQWEQEDRDRAQRKALEDIIKFYYGLDGATKEGLTNLLKDWGWYYGELGAAIDEYNAKLAGQMSVEAWGNEAQDQVLRNLEKKNNIDLNGDGKIGQAGLVSQMLAPTHLTPAMASGGVSQVPAVRSGGGTNRREIHLTGDVSGMDPYIQRVMVNALLEIERNRDG